ncbi:MAG TPA: transglycosylase domain-containing protein [Mycobacteriales bacterium]|nr:transglycosylase domain-containing protein [Mycobacteriales bacterium]
MRGSASVPRGSASAAAGRTRPGTANAAGVAAAKAAARKPAKAAGGAKKPPGKAAAAKRRRRRRIAAIAGITALVVMFGGMGAVYAALQVPLPSDNRVAEVSRIYYSDGKTLMATLGAENRTYVALDQVPVHMQQAIIAAEDRTFYENNGISIGGIARAVWATGTGQEVQGGSTITQQYVKNAHLTSERTISRKFREIGWAIKADQKYTKEEILEFYLNTIYFGRGAHGIEAAAQTYFGVPASKLTVSQSAVLAGVIKAPSIYDPAASPERAAARWDYVLDAMVGQRWLSEQDRAAQEFPATKKVVASNGGSRNLDGWSGLIVQQVEKELKTKGIDEQTIRTGGLKITTTIDKKAQRAAVQAAEKVFSDQAKDMEKALVAVEPGTGRVRAYYGGTRGYGNLDLASSRFRPGSSFKVYTLAAAVADGISIKSYWNGSDNQKFPGETVAVKNSEGSSCARCNLIEATTKSLNTTYYALAQKVGASKVLDVAKAAGVTNPKVDETLSVTRQVALGDLRVSPLEHANGLATLANQGVAVPTAFVQKVEQDGSVVYQRPEPQTTRALDADVAADVTFALRSVYNAGRKIRDGRPGAGKTGTAQLGKSTDNSDAWMVGYTPQLAAAVWVGHSAADKPLRNEWGGRVYGNGVPREFWAEFMSGALDGVAVEQFPAPKYVGLADAGNVASPAPSPVRTVAPSPTVPVTPSTAPPAWPVPSNEPAPSPSPASSEDPAPLFPSPTDSGTGQWDG